MPFYDYRCEDCEKTFSLFLSYSEYGKHAVICPFCGSNRNRRKIDRVGVARPAGSLPSPESMQAAIEGTEDPRALGKMLRDLQEQSGESMPPEFDAVTGRLEKGASIADIDRDFPQLTEDPEEE